MSPSCGARFSPTRRSPLSLAFDPPEGWIADPMIAGVAASQD